MTGISNCKNLKVLFVDDDPSVGRRLVSGLETDGYASIQFTDSEDALILSKQVPFSLAFIDIDLQSMNSLELVSSLKENNPICEIIWMTGVESSEATAAGTIGIEPYSILKKPVSLRDFYLCLKRFQERQSLREQVNFVEHRHFHLVQNIPLLFYVINRNYELDFVNDYCSRMLGFTPEEAMNTSGWFMERIHPDNRKRARDLFMAAFETGSPVSMECKLLQRDGNSIHAVLKTVPPWHDGSDMEDPFLEGFVVDISDRIFLEKTLVQREKLKTLGAISAEVAHEIRNPLVSIGGFAQRLIKKFPHLHECEIILNESRRLVKILSRIRNYIEPVEIHPKECPVAKIIYECVALLSPETKQKKVTCQLALAPGLPVVYADPEVLTQIFINLIRNATNAMKDGGILDIKGYESDHEIRIEFKNHARGLKVRRPENLFVPFAQGGQSIGLPLCYRLLKNMGGLLSFSQQAEFVVFTVSLPKIDQDKPDLEVPEPVGKDILPDVDGLAEG